MPLPLLITGQVGTAERGMVLSTREKVYRTNQTTGVEPGGTLAS
jgi:hypothetical protein